jgi:hypothetical protein
MNRYTRRSMLKGAAAALPTAGIFALPSLARAIQGKSKGKSRTGQKQDRRAKAGQTNMTLKQADSFQR